MKRIVVSAVVPTDNDRILQISLLCCVGREPFTATIYTYRYRLSNIRRTWNRKGSSYPPAGIEVYEPEAALRTGCLGANCRTEPRHPSRDQQHLFQCSAIRSGPKTPNDQRRDRAF